MGRQKVTVGIVSMALLILVFGSHTTAEGEGDIGSLECREVQLAAQNAVIAGEPYRNPGQMVSAAARVVSAAEKDGIINAPCSSCIISQFARRVPLEEQEFCGADPETEACCFPDGSCTDMPYEGCVAAGGQAQGPYTVCVTASCGTFSYEISEQIQPKVSFLPGPGGVDLPIAAYADENGVVTDFVANEVIVAPESQDELNNFLVTYGGTIVGDDSVPEPPASLGIVMAPEYLEPTEYTVRVTIFPDTANFQTDAWQRGVRGHYLFSSEEGVKLMALATIEHLNGMKIQPNWVYYGQKMLHKTEEMPLGGGIFQDGMSDPAFHGPSTPDSNRSTIYKAWQFMAAAGLDSSQSVSVAIIDGGFWLDNTGGAIWSAGVGGRDIPTFPIQYDFHEDDYIADGANVGSCHGTPCPWHGTGSVSVAAGFVDNQVAIAGSGGQVAQPFLFKFGGPSAQIRRAVWTATAWGADVVNMSFGHTCNSDCVEWKEDNNFYLRYQQAFDAGIVLVASAGNKAIDVDANRYEPCVIPGVICVGALESDVNTAKGYSNYGAGVDIWAPTDIPAMPDGDSPNDLTTFGGTSASSPLVAGVAAMMRQANPSLNSDGVKAILQSTAWKYGDAQSSDPKVQGVGYLDAYRAVLSAADGIFPDGFEDNDTSQTATNLSPGHYEELTLNLLDWDYYRFTVNEYSFVEIDLEYMKPMGGIYFTLTPETANWAPSGVSMTSSSEGSNYVATEVAPGTYRLLLSANNAHYYFMDLTVDETGLQPDQFETNNTDGTATELLTSEGSWLLNLHTDGDVDWFLFEIPNIPDVIPPFLLNQEIGIYHADVPMTVEIFDPSTLQLLDTRTGENVAFAFGSAASGDRYLFKISGSYGRYGLKNQTGGDNPWPGLLAYDPFWWLDLLGPVWNPFENVLTEKEAWIAFIQTPELQRMDYINLYAKGLSIKLYNVGEELWLLQEGSPIMDPAYDIGEGQQIGETLDMSGLVPGQTYLLQVYRSIGAEDPVDGSEAVLPLMPYTLVAGVAVQ